tara:strand:- start:220 stop:552 length:333 start_codon:yes stop_codon:yes gene_type:complete
MEAFMKVSELFAKENIESIEMYESTKLNDKDEPVTRYVGGVDGKVRLLTKATTESFGSVADWKKICKSDEIYCIKADDAYQPESRTDTTVTYWVTDKSERKAGAFTLVIG